MTNFLADIITNSFSIIFLVNFFGIFIVSAGFFVRNNNFANLMVANPINIYNSFVLVFIFIKSSTYIFVVLVNSTFKANIIANLFNVNLAINLLALFDFFIAFASSFIKGNSVANLKAANLIVDIYSSLISVFTPIELFINIFLVFINSIIDTGIVSNLFIDILSLIKPPMELTFNRNHEK